MRKNGQLDFIGGGTAISTNTDKVTAEQKIQAVNTYNATTKEAAKAFNDNIDKELAKSREIKEKAASLEIMPTSSYVLVRIYDKNPWEEITVTDSGLILPIYNGEFKSKDTGERDTEDLCIKFAEVIAVGPEVKYLKAGDDIIFRNHTQLPAPFLAQKFWIVGEGNVIVVINEGLEARFNEIKK